MGFCSFCGQFQIQLDSRNHCQTCSDARFRGKINEKDINSANIKIEKKLRTTMLNYIEDIELKPIVIGANFANITPGQRRITFNHNLQPAHLKSTIALIVSFLGILFVLIPALTFFSLGAELLALSLSIGSRRTEQPNWHRRIAFAVSIIYIIFFIISIIYIFMNPEMIEEFLRELETQGF